MGPCYGPLLYSGEALFDCGLFGMWYITGIYWDPDEGSMGPRGL